MGQATYHFPRGFLWGTATAAHQVEGSNTNNTWWAWEQEPGRILQGHKAGLACDWWNGRWRDDFDRAYEAGQNAHRFSVEWSRIQPAQDRWDEDALDRYRQMLRGLRERDMTAVVTLHHFTEPLWVYEQGGWENPQIVEWFNQFTAKVVEAFKEYVSLWVTINEPNVFAFSAYVEGAFPPGKQDFSKAMLVLENMVRAHSAAYRTIHTIQPAARVGAAMYYRGFEPARSWLPLDRLLARLLLRMVNNSFPYALKDGVLPGLLGGKRIPEAKGTLDFLGVHYYSTETAAFSLQHRKTLFVKRNYPPDAELSETGFIAHRPDGMFEALKWGRQFGVPMIVTENGVDDSTDSLRPRYLVEHLHQVWRAVNFNWPVKGYFHWTLVDNFEWERGWTQRFGLWELDIETQARRKRPSADLYAEICRENGISYAMVQKYALDALPNVFPD